MNHKKLHPARELPAAAFAPTLMTRREMLRNTALGTASTLLMLSALPEQAQSAAALGHPIGGPSNQPLPGTHNDFAQLPLWGDGARWDRQQYYASIIAGRRLFPKTFHHADIDGDGRDELIGRGPGGIEINRFDPSSGQWVVMNVPKSASGKPIWSDQDGWNKLSCCQTIQCADVDKDGRDELIGRGPNGIEVYKYNDSSGIGIWSAFPWPTDLNHSNLGLWSDQAQANWNLPQYFQTIQCADLDNDGQAELIGRGPHGIEVWKYDLPNKMWYIVLFGPTWSDADKFDQYLYYPSIQCADVDGDKSAELIARGPKGIEIYKFVAAPHDTFVLKPMPVPQSNGVPIWSDAAGWENTSYSLTIQCADIDGDGQAELMGRGKEGIQIYKFDRLTGQWGSLEPFPPDPTHKSDYLWGDAAGWNAPAYYLTIQCADIDGDGRDELISRGRGGIEIYKYLVLKEQVGKVGTSAQWISIPAFFAEDNAAFAWNDANGWDQYQFYSTVQTARVLKPGTNLNSADIGYTGDGTHVQSVLMARGSLGMQTWRYDRTFDKAFRTSVPVSAVSPHNDNDLEKAAFLEVGKALLPTNPPLNIREKYIDASKSDFDSWQRQMYIIPPRRYDMPKAERPRTNLLPVPNGIDKDAWESVVWQVYWETIWAANVRDWFGNNMQTLITDQAIAKDLLLQQVADKLKIAPDNTTAIVLNFLILLSAGCAAMFAFSPVPPLAAATGFLGAIIRYVSVSLPGGGNAFQLTFDKLKDHLATSFTAALTENGNFLRRVLAIPTTLPDGSPTTVPEYGLMKAIGQMIHDTSWAWPGDLTAKAVVSMSRSYATSVWQAFWQARGRNLGWYTQSDGTHGVPGDYMALGPYFLTTSHQPKNWYYLTTSTNWYVYPPLETLQALFDKPDPASAFPLAVPLEDVFEGLNGWPRLPYIGRYGGEPPPGNPSLPPGFTIQPSLYPQVVLSRDPNTNEILAAITIYNQGLTAVTNFEITDASLNGRKAAPTGLQTLVQQGDPQTILLRFPDIPKTTGANLKLSGSYLGGKFDEAIPVDVPD